MREELLRLMAEHGHRFREEPFTLVSGRRSQHYFDCKKVTLWPDRLWLLAGLIVEEMLPRLSGFQGVGGLTMGADPLAYGISSYSFANKKNIIWPLIVRKTEKDHGTQSRIEGNLDAVSAVIALDDVVTTGGSTLQAVQAFRTAGKTVEHAMVILDREEGGREALEKEGVVLHAIFSKSDFLLQGQTDV